MSNGYHLSRLSHLSPHIQGDKLSNSRCKVKNTLSVEVHVEKESPSHRMTISSTGIQSQSTTFNPLNFKNEMKGKTLQS